MLAFLLDRLDDLHFAWFLQPFLTDIIFETVNPITMERHSNFQNWILIYHCGQEIQSLTLQFFW